MRLGEAVAVQAWRCCRYAAGRADDGGDAAGAWAAG